MKQYFRTKLKNLDPTDRVVSLDLDEQDLNRYGQIDELVVMWSINLEMREYGVKDFGINIDNVIFEVGVYDDNDELVRSVHSGKGLEIETFSEGLLDHKNIVIKHIEVDLQAERIYIGF